MSYSSDPCRVSFVLIVSNIVSVTITSARLTLARTVPQGKIRPFGLATAPSEEFTNLSSPAVVLNYRDNLTTYEQLIATGGPVNPLLIPGGGGGGGNSYYTWSATVCIWQQNFFGNTLWKMCLTASWTADWTTGQIVNFQNPGDDDFLGSFGCSMTIAQDSASQVGPAQVNYFAENALYFWESIRAKP